MKPNSFAARDIAFHIHSQTDLKLHETVGPVVMVSAKGATVTDDAGRTYLEAMSGLWCAALGFSEERLIQAAERQLRTLPYYQNFAHRATPPAIDLAEKLIEIAPVPMSKVLFQSSGSEANDTAIKLVWYHFAGQGRPEKRKILSHRRGYHGTSIGTASLTGLGHLHQDFHLPLDGFIHMRAPHFYRESELGETEEQFAERLIEELEARIEQEGADTIAAFMLEPAMGTGACVIPPRSYLAKLQLVLKKHEILLICDEVITGFGRTGELWGSTTFGLEPDILTCAKALTGAYIPLSAVLVSEPIYAAMRAQSEKLGTFGHGYTYGGHPVACAIALEAIAIYEERDIAAVVRDLGNHLEARLRPLEDHPHVGEVRGIGLMWGVEFVQDKSTRKAFAPDEKVGPRLQQAAFERGLIVRALGDTLVIAPPFIITKEQLDEAADTFSAIISEVLGQG